MSDFDCRRTQRNAATGDPEAQARLAAQMRRHGMYLLLLWDGSGYGNGNGRGYGYGYGNGNGRGYGYGYGNGYGSGHGNGNGNGNGYGDGYGDGDGNGYGDGYGYGDGNGKTKDLEMRHTDYVKQGTPVGVRSYVSGVFVGRLAGGEGSTVVLRDLRWLRRWEAVGNEGSVYDLVESGKAPTRRGPLLAGPQFLQQADPLVVSEECYERLIGG